MATTTMRRPKMEDERTHSADDKRRDSSTVANDEIARRAYELYEERGRESGHALEDWLRAEHDVEQRRSGE